MKKAAAVAKTYADKLATVTLGEVWAVYMEERRPHWGALHYRDHVDKAKAGGLPSGRRGGGKQLTKPGPLAELMPLALKNLDQPRIEAWAAKALNPARSLLKTLFLTLPERSLATSSLSLEIGRASCRERVYLAV